LAIAFSQALDLGEGKLPGHAQRVSFIATMLADAYEIESAERAGIYFGSLLHDIGVTPASAELYRASGIDEDVVFGPSPLRQHEEGRSELIFADHTVMTEALHQHCSLGADLIRSLELPDEVVAAVESHHERWDGEGFPAAIAAEEIPLSGRIIAAADVAEVIISEESNA